MGDFPSSKKRDVFNRLRRRFEEYRRHHNTSNTYYDNTINNIYEHQSLETLNHRQRWLDSKAKKASKQSKASRESAGSQTNLIPRLKRRLDVNQGDGSTTDGADTEGSSAKQANNGTTSEINFSVRIEQQDNNVKLDVHATVGSKGESSVETTANVKCEQKQSPDDCSNENENLSPSDNISINDEDIDFILRSMVENNQDENLLEEINKFEKICQSKFSDDSNNSNDTKMYPLMKSPGLPTKIESNSPIFNGNPKYPVNSPHLQNFSRAPSTSMSEGTLPAAETLKQLAANHQNQSTGSGPYPPYPGHQISPDTGQFPPNSGYPPNYDPPTPSHYNPNQGPYMNNMHGHVPFNQSKSEAGLTYNGTKPLTHYQPSVPVSVQQTQPQSSLQQLQNQVQSHFSQSPQMEITQTQHVQVTDGASRMQMSQTQQVHMRQPPQQMSISQQQSFSVPGANMGPNSQNSQYMNEQMKMQMMQEKMRRDRQAKARSLLESQRQQQQQYMNRPPPEYKMQQSAPEGYPGADMGPNPLQTMQNMVNQTNTMPSAQYSHIKSESASVQMPNGMMQSHQVTAMQQRVGSGHMPDMPQGNQPYPIQRQQSYPGAHPHPLRPQRHPPESTFTSSIMRNQRPPNVNVGPDGLNISQPRGEWPRPMMNQQMSRQPMSSGMPQMSAQVGMMQYQYANQNGMGGSSMPGMQGPPARPMQMGSMQSQPMMPQSHPMMMHQSMQMSQRMAMERDIWTRLIKYRMDQIMRTL
ncbi:LOW QUALITY PROTEIN: mediator of RNA polymerase II transcription subunit 12-like [Saccostrea cucullata]|uniref:LOW QUALITY PROTEIN: mediator of RNA polymerase II transcription subunit 12-like n=1 Tax=Saccostrea cuccullata TaxID=36930 RepID=UPI002ED575EF